MSCRARSIVCILAMAVGLFAQGPALNANAPAADSDHAVCQPAAATMVLATSARWDRELGPRCLPTLPDCSANDCGRSMLRLHGLLFTTHEIAFPQQTLLTLHCLLVL